MGEGDARGRSWLRLAVVGIVLAAAAAGVPASLAGSGVPGAGVRAASAQERPDAAGGPEFVPGEVLVKLKKDAPAGSLEGLNRANNARVSDRVPGTRLALVELPPGLSVVEAVGRYEGNASVAYAEPNFTYEPAITEPNDPQYTKNIMWNAKNTGQVYRKNADGTQLSGTFDADLDLPEVWDITTGSPNVQVAVIDTGTNVSHPDLKGNLWTNPDELAGNGVDDDRNGYTDDVHGWDFANEDNTLFDDPTEDRHGTLVSSTAVAEGNNSTEISGIAWNSQLVPLKVITPTGITSVDAVQAVRYAADEGFEVTNNSWGGGSYSQSLRDAIAYANGKGTLFVASAGNGDNRNDVLGSSVGQDNDATPFYPASYDEPNVISVSASDSKDELTRWSNYGATGVDVAAPGLDVPCASADGTGGNWYCYGTSFAAPNVSGVAALVKSKSPGMTPAEVRTAIIGGADKKSSLQGKNVANGRVNAVGALDGTIDRVPPTVTAPTAVFSGGSTLGSPSVPVRVSWSGNDGAGSGIAGYELQRSEDGVSWQGVPLPSPTSASVGDNLTPGTSYVYRVRATDAARNVGDWATATELSIQAVQESSSAVSYGGGWTQQSLTSAYGGGTRYTVSVTNASLTFNGGEIAWVSSEGPNRGKAEVYIDGAYEKTLSLYDASLQPRKVMFSKSLPAGNHSIRVKALDQKQAVSSNTRVDVDAFLVVP